MIIAFWYIVERMCRSVSFSPKMYHREAIADIAPGADAVVMTTMVMLLMMVTMPSW